VCVSLSLSLYPQDGGDEEDEAEEMSEDDE